MIILATLNPIHRLGACFALAYLVLDLPHQPSVRAMLMINTICTRKFSKAASSPRTPDLNNTYGALFIGLLIAAVLFGITNLQVFIYSQSYKEDRIWSKIAVWWLWLLDAFHFALTSHAVYFYLITNYANPLELIHVVWSFRLQVVVDMVTILTVQALYAIRLWQLTELNEIKRRKIVPSVVTLLVFAAAGICAGLSKRIYDLHDFFKVYRLRGMTFLALVTASIVDVMIAASLCFSLGKLRTGVERTDSTINSLMLYILNTGVLTSLCSIIAVALFGAYPHNFIFLAVECLLARLYVNAFLAMLNARRCLHVDVAINVHKQPDHSGQGVTEVPKMLSLHITQHTTGAAPPETKV